MHEGDQAFSSNKGKQLFMGLRRWYDTHNHFTLRKISIPLTETLYNISQCYVVCVTCSCCVVVCLWEMQPRSSSSLVPRLYSRIRAWSILLTHARNYTQWVNSRRGNKVMFSWLAIRCRDIIVCYMAHDHKARAVRLPLPNWIAGRLQQPKLMCTNLVALFIVSQQNLPPRISRLLFTRNRCNWRRKLKPKRICSKCKRRYGRISSPHHVSVFSVV